MDERLREGQWKVLAPSVRVLADGRQRPITVFNNRARTVRITRMRARMPPSELVGRTQEWSK
jgi:hypothetical protein